MLVDEVVQITVGLVRDADHADRDARHVHLVDISPFDIVREAQLGPLHPVSHFAVGDAHVRSLLEGHVDGGAA